MANTSSNLMLAGLLGWLAIPSLRADAEPTGTPLVRVDQPAVRARGEQALLSRIPGSKPGDFKFQCLYYKLDPSKPVNEETITVVFLENAPADIRKEDFSEHVTRLIHRRRQHQVEMSPMGTVLRVSVKMVEQTELVNRN